MGRKSQACRASLWSVVILQRLPFEFGILNFELRLCGAVPLDSPKSP